VAKPEAITVHLVRHGQVHNPARVVYGRLPDYHLSDRGRRQAGAAAEHLQDIKVKTLVASPLERAQETAEIIAKLLALEITTDDRVIESGSDFEGVGRNILALLISPVQWWRLRNPFKPSWGESFSDIRKRMLEAIEDAAGGPGEGDVVIVSHQTPILVARFGLAHRSVPPWLGRTPCQTGSVTTLTLEGDSLVSASYFSPSDVSSS
jgi:broad specificity phosphatase PhoE